MVNLLAVAIGGALGALSRYGIDMLIVGLWQRQAFPFTTLVVNVLGCLLIGFLGAWGELKNVFSETLRLFIFLGFISSFTTFSSFAYEVLHLAKDQHIAMAITNIVAQLVLGLLAVWLGYRLSYAVFH